MVTEAAARIDVARKNLDWHERRLAIVGLGHQREPEVFPVLLECLDDPVSEVRHAAVIALGRYGDARAVPELLRPKTLRSSDPLVRWAAVQVLGKLAGHDIIERMVEMVDDEEWLVSNEALVVLRDRVEKILQLDDPGNARVLIRMLNIRDDVIVEMAQQGLRDFDRSASPLLREALKSLWEPVRRHAAEVIGAIADPECLPGLFVALGDDGPGVRAAAATAIGCIGDRTGIGPLIGVIGDFDETVRDAAVDSLCQFGSDATHLICIALEHSTSKLARCSAIDALGVIGDERAIPILIEQLSSSYHLVRRATITSLRHFGEAVVEPLIRMLSFNTSDIAQLVDEVTGSSDAETRIRAVNALGVLEDHRAVEALKGLLSDEDTRLASAAHEALGRIGCAAWGRGGAARVLGMIGDRRAIHGILGLLDDDSVTVRTAAVSALAMGVGNELDAGRLLVVVRQDADPVVRDCALTTLRELIPGTVELFDAALAGLDDVAAEVRVRATRIVGEYSDSRALEPLLKLLSDHSWSVRVAAESGLVSRGKQAVPHLIEVLKRGTMIARRRAYSALGRIGDPSAAEAVEHLVGREEDPVSIRLARETLRVLWGGEEPS